MPPEEAESKCKWEAVLPNDRIKHRFLWIRNHQKLQLLTEIVFYLRSIPSNASLGESSASPNDDSERSPASANYIRVEGEYTHLYILNSHYIKDV